MKVFRLDENGNLIRKGYIGLIQKLFGAGDTEKIVSKVRNCGEVEVKVSRWIRGVEDPYQLRKSLKRGFAALGAGGIKVSVEVEGPWYRVKLSPTPYE